MNAEADQARLLAEAVELEELGKKPPAPAQAHRGR